MADKASGTATMNKMDCVKKALETLGYEARPVDLRAHIKKNFNVDMTTDHISANKSTILKKRGKPTPTAKPAVATTPATKTSIKPAPKKKIKRKPTPAVKVATPAPKVTMPASLSAKSGNLNLLQEAQTVKGLVDRLGKDNLQTLINFVTK